jgi:C-terminal processing protease CtpA/Prc
MPRRHRQHTTVANTAGAGAAIAHKRLQASTQPPPGGEAPLWHSIVSSLAILSLSLSLSIAPAFAQEPTLVGTSSSLRYWTILQHGPKEERVVANEALVDHAVGTVNTMYYDNSGGAYFQPRDFYKVWLDVRNTMRTGRAPSTSKRIAVPTGLNLETREGAVKTIRYMISTLNDPFSSYLTREELREELQTGATNGFLGLGAIVEAPNKAHVPLPIMTTMPVQNKQLLSATRAANLPIVSAVAPDSAAERAGLTVGDRIVAVGTDHFLGMTVERVGKALGMTYAAKTYAGYPYLTVAKPVWASVEARPGDVVVGYRTSHVRMPTTAMTPFREHDQVKGDSIVHYELLTSSDSILDQSSSPVGYIRLTRFSRAATTGYLKAIRELEAAGAQSYIIDIRNNYGGVIQEAMLTASTLLRDPHAVLCYTMNSRGGFTPHDAEEYIVDSRFPGYLLSKEPPTVTRDQVRRASPEMFADSGINWVPPSSYASLHEQRTKRGIRIGGMQTVGNQLKLQKKIVILVNEGTASSAEVFASSLHDNGRAVALVGSRTYGKGLIQHTFPMPDGGGLRLTVAEYLTPSLQHVTKIGSARFDRDTGDLVGGGIRPDILCDSKQGIPSNVGADLCVGIALDALEDADMEEMNDSVLKRVGGSNGGSGTRRSIVAGVVKVSIAKQCGTNTMLNDNS